MKLQISNSVLAASLLALAAPHPAQAAFVHDGGPEFTSSGDFNGDGLSDVIVVTRSTGLYRVGYATAGGAFSWGQPQPSGVTGLAGVATGRVNSTTQDSVFFSSTEGNRITFTTPASLIFNPTTDWLLTGVGPKIIATLDIAGGSPANTAHADLVTGSVLNPFAQSSSLRSIRSTGNSTLTQLGSLGSTDQWIRAIALKPNAAAAEMVLVQRTTGATEAFTLYNVSTGTPAATVVAATGLPAGSRIAHGTFDSTQTDIMSFVTGSPSVIVRRINSGVNGFASTITRTLPGAVAQLYVINNGSGNQVLVLDAAGAARVYNYTLTSGFTVAAIPPLTGAPGVLSGATVTGNGTFQLLFASAAGQPSTHLWRFTASGGSWSKQGEDVMPQAGPNAGMANVLLLNAPPFVTASPQVLRRSSVGDWTDSVSLSGAPQAATAVWRDDLGALVGLGSGTPQSLGLTPGGTQGALYNQWRPSISCFWLEGQTGGLNEEVKASPAGGTFQASVSVALTARSGASAIYYRTSPASAFSLYSAPVALYTDTTLEMYALASGLPSAIQKADFRFLAPPEKQDTDSDGVPDFVERAQGLDPTKGADSDGDGFSDLEEILAGSGPHNSLIRPAAHAASSARFDIHATVTGHNGVTNLPAAPENEEELTARDTGSASLGTGFTTNGTGLVDLTAQPVESSLRLLTLATASNFPLIGAAPDADIGREIVALQAVPDGVAVSVPFTYNAASPATQPAAWTAAAQTAYAAATPATVTTTINFTDTLVTALMEWGVSGLARQRGLVGATEQVCFTKWRPSDAINANLKALSGEELRTMEIPGEGSPAASTPCVLVRSALAALASSVDSPSGAALVEVAREVYRISSRYGNASPGLYAAPLDALREFIWTGAVPAAYLAQTTLTPQQTASASASIGSLVANAMTVRPLLTIIAMPSATPAGCTAVEALSGGAHYALLDDNGQPFEWPETFSLPAGSQMTIIGYTDRPTSCGVASIEVVSVLLTTLGAPSPMDADGNLLPDAWELAFFGATGQDPATSGDGSSFSRLQEYFEGTDPGCNTSSPATRPVAIAITNVRIDESAPGALRLRFDFPAAYAGRVVGRFASSADLGSWQDMPEAAFSGGSFAHVTTPVGNRRFYRARVSLR